MQLKITIEDKKYTFLSFDDNNIEDLKIMIKALVKKEDKVSAYMQDHFDSNNDGQTLYKIYNWITRRYNND